MTKQSKQPDGHRAHLEMVSIKIGRIIYLDRWPHACAQGRSCSPRGWWESVAESPSGGDAAERCGGNCACQSLKTPGRKPHTAEWTGPTKGTEVGRWARHANGCIPKLVSRIISKRSSVFACCRTIIQSHSLTHVIKCILKTPHSCINNVKEDDFFFF